MNVEIKNQYANMLQVIEKNPKVYELLKILSR
jgi:hypothetical protein